MATAGIVTLGWLEANNYTGMNTIYGNWKGWVHKHRASHNRLTSLLGRKNKGERHSKPEGSPYSADLTESSSDLPFEKVGPGDLRQPGDKRSIPPLRFQLSTVYHSPKILNRKFQK